MEIMPGVYENIANKDNDSNKYENNAIGTESFSINLLNKDELIKALRMAYKKVNQNCCDENTSCYNCLRNYYNQQYHKYLRRKDAKEIIEQIFQILDIPLEK